jgi:hypothetical protein
VTGLYAKAPDEGSGWVALLGITPSAPAAAYPCAEVKTSAPNTLGVDAA